MKKNPYPGKFVVLEGLDGSGQTTQSELLKDFLISKEHSAIVTKEPTQESDAGKRIRRILDMQETASPKEFQELFARDRKYHLQHSIIPALQQGNLVISDRYFFSSFAYGAAEEVDLEYLIQINNEFLLPDLSFFLNVRPELCMERMKERGKPLSYFENLDRLGKTWNVFELLANRFENVHPINGEQSIEKVAKDIQQIMIKTLL